MSLPGKLTKMLDSATLWPSYFPEKGTTFNSHPNVKKGEVVMIIEDPYGPQLGEGSHRIKVLSSKGPGWVSAWLLEER